MTNGLLSQMNLARVLIAHNAYQQRGGEDAVVDAEVELLRSNGHEVLLYERSNSEILRMSSGATAVQTLWSRRTVLEVSDVIESFRPDIIHVHNTFPLISPSLFWAATRASVPVVQTLHNFRLLCLNGLFFRDGKVCEDCQGRMPWKGVRHKCYRDSVGASVAAAATLALHRGLGSYKNKVARFIALNQFCREKLIEGGLPSERVVIKPNFVACPSPLELPRSGLLFVGRISAEKGVETLAAATALLPEATVRVAGSGPDMGRISGRPGLNLLGALPSHDVRMEMNSAVALVVPSVWFESFPRTIVEAFASGLPVIASRLGALASLIQDGETGLLFNPSDPQDLAVKMSWALSHPDAMAVMGKRARMQYELEFSPEKNYALLMGIYEGAIGELLRGH